MKKLLLMLILIVAPTIYGYSQNTATISNDSVKISCGQLLIANKAFLKLELQTNLLHQTELLLQNEKEVNEILNNQLLTLHSKIQTLENTNRINEEYIKSLKKEKQTSTLYNKVMVGALSISVGALLYVIVSN